MSDNKKAVAKAKYLRISPSKVRRVAKLVRGKDLKYSKEVLKVLPHKGAQLLFELVKSAEANASHNFNLKTDELFVSKLLVNEGPRFKRFQARARGRIFPIIKRTCHMEIELAERKKG